MELEVNAGAEARSAARCANCRITLRAEAVLIEDRQYCCEGCAAGGPCCC